MDSKKERDLGKIAKSASTKFILTVVFIAVAIVGGFMVAINQLHLSFIYVSGNSMSPDLENRDIAVVKHQEYINPGQVVVFKEPRKWKQYNSDNVYDYNVNTVNNENIVSEADDKIGEASTENKVDKGTDKNSKLINSTMGYTYFIKNVVALVGQELTVNKQGVHVDGQNVFDFKENDYVCKAAEAGEEYSGILNEQQVFVMGTNHKASFDSLRVFCNYDTDDMFLNSAEVTQHGEVLSVL